jgi:hypothetical protein
LHDELSIGRALQEIVALSKGRNPRDRDEDLVKAELEGFSLLINRAHFSYQSPAYQQATPSWYTRCNAHGACTRCPQNTPGRTWNILPVERKKEIICISPGFEGRFNAPTHLKETQVCKL